MCVKNVIPIGVGMNWTQPYVETNYSLPSFSQYVAGQVAVSGSSGATATSSPGGKSASAANAAGVGMGAVVVALSAVAGAVLCLSA